MLATSLSSSAKEEANPPFTDKYTVERVIGRGGMGTVFEARHVRLGHLVAIKVLGEELRVHPELVKRFEREARAASALSSPHACRVFDIDATDDGTPFIVMELLHGRDLAQIVEHDGPQAVGLAVRWIIEACDAIAEAHRLGIIHRDIKPSNLLLCDTGSIKVLDFGIAKHVTTQKNEAAITLGIAPLGTPQYMSPEQVRCAKDVDARTDIWSLAVTLYELVTGRPPYNHEAPQACIAAIVADPVPDPREFRPDLPAGLADAMLRALSKDSNGRFSDVDAFVHALEPFADETPSPDLGSWRVISASRRAAAAIALAAKEQSTLDGDDLVLDLSLSGPEKLIEEQTAPPTVSRASVASSRGKRVRSSLAVASAAVLGLAALIATPKFVGARLDAAQSQSQPQSQSQSASPSSESTNHVGDAVAKAANNTLPADTRAESKGIAEASPSPSSSTTTPRNVAAKPAKPPVRPLNSGPVRFIGTERPVHGGISNPGF